MKSSGKLLAFGLAGGAVIAAAGCGSSTPSEPGSAALISSTEASIHHASSVHVDGAGSDNGLPVGVDVGINRAGDLNGTIREHGANLDVISASGKVYIKATPEVLKLSGAPASACTLVCGRWIELPPSEAKQLTSQLTMSSVTGGNTSSDLSKYTEDGSTTVNGQPAWVLKGPNGNEVDVSQQPAHYPLQAKSGTGNHGVVRFSQWDSVPAPTPPPASQVINLGDLK
jgi:hypothetical protein